LVRPHNPTAAVGSDLQKEIAMAWDSYTFRTVDEFLDALRA
jgi:hypothetical protein